MLKANELRCGNLVDEGLPEFIIVGKQEIFDCDETRFFNGIPLTPEILGKCTGFKETDNGWMILNKKRYVSLKLLKIRVDWAVTNLPNDTRVKHLHQLQNLFFALTGEEIEIKLHATPLI